MPEDKYNDILPNQTGFSKAAVDRCVREHAYVYDLTSVFALCVRAWTHVCACVRECVRAHDLPVYALCVSAKQWQRLNLMSSVMW